MYPISNIFAFVEIMNSFQVLHESFHVSVYAAIDYLSCMTFQQIACDNEDFLCCTDVYGKWKAEAVTNHSLAQEVRTLYITEHCHEC